ncbi:leucine-rich repeat protein [Gallibacterium anatis]|uniref:leucine-rich repeat protein n=1 Tax=Gallibacterium anatis TaxID=750 RepID=UPI003006DCC5
MNIAEKLEKINAIKNEIRSAIESKSVVISKTTPFEQYPEKINEIDNTASPKASVRKYLGDKKDFTQFAVFTEISAYVYANTKNATKLVYETAPRSNVRYPVTGRDPRARATQLIDVDLSSAIALEGALSGFTKLTDDGFPERIETSQGTYTAEYLFAGCENITRCPNIILPNKIISLSYAFEGCKKLVEPPTNRTILGTYSASYMFSGCVGLTDFSAEMPNLYSAVGMFKNCENLTSVNIRQYKPLTYVLAMFDGCTKLTRITGVYTNAASTAYVFSGCSSLVEIPDNFFGTLEALGDDPTLTESQSTFAGCSALTRVPYMNLSQATRLDAIFKGCTSLTDINAVGMKVSFSVADTKLDAEGLNKLFRNLATVTDNVSINISGTPGEEGCDKSIATEKGWRVISTGVRT